MPVVARLQIIIVTVVLMMAAAAIDTPAAEREKLLTDPGVFVTFAAFRLDEDWSKLDRGGRTSAAATAKEAIQRHTADAAIDAYLLRGLSDHADVLLRVHASELQTNQQVILDLLASSLGRHLTPVYVFNGLTKKANYAPAFPDEMKTALKATPEPGAKRYAIVIPIRKDAAWWLLDKETRTGMMKEHTEASLPYLKTVTAQAVPFDRPRRFRFHHLFRNVESRRLSEPGARPPAGQGEPAQPPLRQPNLARHDPFHG